MRKGKGFLAVKAYLWSVGNHPNPKCNGQDQVMETAEELMARQFLAEKMSKGKFPHFSKLFWLKVTEGVPIFWHFYEVCTLYNCTRGKQFSKR